MRAGLVRTETPKLGAELYCPAPNRHVYRETP